MTKKISYQIIILFISALLSEGLLFNFSPVRAQMDLLGTPTASDNFVLSWSADSYVPASYAGKALPTRGSEIRMAVEPAKKLSLDPEKLTYRWLLDDGIAGYASGQGKLVFRFQVIKWAGDTHKVSVQILDASGNLLALKSQSIQIMRPEILLTKLGSSYALQNTLQVNTGQEINFWAIPLFFNVKNLAEVVWQWTLANQALSGSDEKDLNKLTLKIPAGTLSQTLEQNLSVNATNKDDRYQQAAASLSVDIK